MTVQQTIKRELQLLADDIVRNYRAKGMKASGRFEKTINVVMTDIGGKIMAEDYSEQLELGQPAGKEKADDKKFRDKIEQWTIDKRINPQGISRQSLAYLIARKIEQEGWDRRDYGGVNLLSEVITSARISKIEKAIGQAVEIEIADFMKQQFAQV